MGRPTKLTPEVHERIANAIRRGNYIETAAALAGISKVALYDWLHRGAAELARIEGNARRSGLASEAIYFEFSNAVALALAESEDHDLGIINNAAEIHEVKKIKQTIDKDGNTYESTERSWEFDAKAAMWKLERKFPDRWGQVTKTRHTGATDDTPIKVQTLAELMAQGDDDGDL